MWQFVGMGMALGAALGLTGSGGAIVGIPFLMTATGIGVKQATALILPIVGVSACLAWIPQRQDTKWKILGVVVAPTLIAAHGAAWVKPWLPEWSLIALLMTVATLGLFQTWMSSKKKASEILSCSLPRLMGMGLLSGALSTLTGLGGGLLLVPLLESGCHLELKEAVSTSLGIIVLNTIVASSMLALHGHTQWLPLSSFFQIGCGTVLSSAILKKGLSKVPPSFKLPLQKGLYSLLMCATLFHLLIHL